MRHFHPKPVASRGSSGESFPCYFSGTIMSVRLLWLTCLSVSMPQITHRRHTSCFSQALSLFLSCLHLRICNYVPCYLLTTKYTYVIYSSLLSNRIRMDDARSKFYLLRTYMYVYNFSDNASNLHLDVQVSIEFLCNRCNVM